MFFCIRLPNFVQIGTLTAEIWCHLHFSRWRPQGLNTTSGFLIVDATVFGRSKSISKPNFVDISQFTAASDFDIGHFAVIGVLSCVRLPNFVKIGSSTTEIWRHIDFQDGSCRPWCICFGVLQGGPPTCLLWSERGPQIACSLMD